MSIISAAIVVISALRFERLLGFLLLDRRSGLRSVDQWLRCHNLEDYFASLAEQGLQNTYFSVLAQKSWG